jgi:cell division transport system permease protein
MTISLKLNSKVKYKNAKTDNNNFGLNTWYKNHRLACNDSVKTLSQAPISNLFTMLILGIALALPVLLYLVILNIGGSLNAWEQSFYQYSIYLDNNYTEQQAVGIKNTIAAWPEVNKVNIISKEQGMAELKTVMGIDNIVSTIQDNPLPIVLVVTLKDKYKNLKNIKTLINKKQNSFRSNES